MVIIKHLVVFIIFLSFNFTLFAQEEVNNDSTELIYGKITRIIDGDTLDFLTSKGNQIKVRLVEIDAPEIDQKFGIESKNNLVELCEGKEGYIEKTGEDYFYRTVARVFCGEKNANIYQLITGMAWVFDEYNKSMENYRYQFKAKKKGLGLWAEEFPLAPWDFRKGKKSFETRIQELEKKIDDLNDSYKSQLAEYEKVIEELNEKLNNIDKESTSNNDLMLSCIKKSCKQMLNCEEAYFQYQQCGNTGLDHDKDGIPCESICS